MMDIGDSLSLDKVTLDLKKKKCIMSVCLDLTGL